MRKIIIVLSALMMITSLSACDAASTDSSSNKTANNSSVSESDSDAESNEESKSDLELSKVDVEAVAHRETSIGVSDKNIEDLNGTFYDSVRNDVTGGWKCLVIASDINITEYALSAYNQYYNGASLLVIENLTSKECAVITDLGDTLDVSIHEYIDGEEHDANLMASGALISQYWVYTDNGDIENIS